MKSPGGDGGYEKGEGEKARYIRMVYRDLKLAAHKNRESNERSRKRAKLSMFCGLIYKIFSLQYTNVIIYVRVFP